MKQSSPKCSKLLPVPIPPYRQTDGRTGGRTNKHTDRQSNRDKPTNQPTHQPTKDDNIAFAVRQMWWIKMIMMMQLIAKMQCSAIITRSFFSPIARGGSSVTSVHGVPLVNSEFMLYRCHRSCVQCHDMLDRVIMTPGPSFIKPDQLDPWIKDQKRNALLYTILSLQLPNFVSCHMTQNLVTVGVKLLTGEWFLFDPWSMDQADLVW